MQTVLMWPWSRNSECGRFSAVRAMFAPPDFDFTTTRICGFLARVVPPLMRAFSVGLNGSELQPVAPYAAETVAVVQAAASAGLEPPPLTGPATAPAAQLVGLTMNWLRFMFRSIERTSSLTPPNTFGIGSETASICAVAGLTSRRARTTTVPRSYGPATAGVTTANESGAPLYGPAR